MLASLSMFSVLAAVASMPQKIDPMKNCTLEWVDQTLDHFAYTSEYYKTFKQRVFVCGEENWTPGDPIFFYCGNEADVTLYVKHTGLMWENKDAFKALLVFAEHRYYGETLPFGNESFSNQNIRYLNHEQALGDYASVIREFKKSRKAEASKVVAFGGSYGGMLAGWLRMKYPTSIVGAIAASAPLVAFTGMGLPSYDIPNKTFGNSFWEIVTRDATPAAGARPNCDSAIRSAFSTLLEMGKSDQGRVTLSKIFKTCSVLKDEKDVHSLAMIQLFAFDNMAMGNFPYPSDYLTGQTGNVGVDMPAFPMRESCKEMVTENGTAPTTPEGLLKALDQAAGIFNNVTKKVTCLNTSIDVEQDGIWDFQWCTEMQPQETYFSRTGTTDMFWEYDFNMTFVNNHCKEKWGVTPRTKWLVTEYGTVDQIGQFSNIVFSNGFYDPWSSGGVYFNSTENGILSLTIAEGAHHLDLMFSNPKDPQCVKDVRNAELGEIRKWLSQ
eukprot:TRINITY_DN12734_c0_g1_i1.p1 TRINITY_DN12734_c0_g1~~TRINITY_DN12734_c0_g1_i1.p1  ORF type:complete len:516 (+),score=118.00 TRINITY_DN12734_c0_g1_i1:64-1548(+)